MMRVAIVGAGIAGASLAWHLRGRAEVVLLEAEDQPGYHTTGRSAAFFSETYGGPGVQPLSTASLPFFLAPPEGFDGPLLNPRGCLHVTDDKPLLDGIDRDFAGSGVVVEPAVAPDYMRGGWAGAARFEPGCRDIDVAALHHGFLAGARRAGATLVPGAAVVAIEPGWRIETRAGRFEADAIVVAAGAWADEVAALAGARPLGLTALRRTVSVVRTTPTPGAELPLVIDAAGSFYFKPDAGRLWLSPHDETPDVPGDVQPHDIDVATAIDRFERATSFRVEHVERSWAGLRTFAPDRLPVYGWDADVAGLFWCAGQGGYGIQTAPAAGRLAAALLLGEEPSLQGVAPARYAASRFSKPDRLDKEIAP